MAEYEDGGGDAFDDVPDYDDYDGAGDMPPEAEVEVVGSSGATSGTLRSATMVSDTQGLEWLLAGRDGDDKKVTGNAWAGPGSWHFPRTAANAKGGAAAASKGGEENGVKEKKTKRTGPLFDFENLPPFDDADFKLAEKASEICMTSAVTAFNSMLPKDVNYKPQDLARLFMLPQVRCRAIHPCCDHSQTMRADSAGNPTSRAGAQGSTSVPRFASGISQVTMLESWSCVAVFRRKHTWELAGQRTTPTLRSDTQYGWID